MFEKVNPGHPDKVADRIAGAIVDLCYTKSRDPKVACEVLIGHGECNIQVETSEQISAEDIGAIVERIAGEDIETRALIVPQDSHLAANQRQGVRCGDNGIFKGVPPTHEQKLLTAIAACSRLRRDHLPKSSEPWAGTGTARASEECLRHPPAHDQPAGRVDGWTEHGQRCDEQETWQRYGRRCDGWRLDGQGFVEV